MLRHISLALGVALACALVSIGGPSVAKGDNQGADWLVAGTGTIAGFGDPMVHVNAQSNTGGINPRGHFWIRYPNGGAEFGGEIVCLSVLGNSAALVGHIEQVKVANPPAGFVMGNYLTIRITDNGSPGAADLVNFDPGSSSRTPCGGVGDLAISQGNYVVHDQPVLDLSALNALNLQIAQFEAQADDPYGG
jgi:hypothetical protein